MTASAKRSRPVAFEPRLELAVRSRAPFRSRSLMPPDVLTQRALTDVAPSVGIATTLDTASYSFQTQGGNYPSSNLSYLVVDGEISIGHIDLSGLVIGFF